MKIGKLWRGGTLVNFGQLAELNLSNISTQCIITVCVAHFAKVYFVKNSPSRDFPTFSPNIQYYVSKMFQKSSLLCTSKWSILGEFYETPCNIMVCVILECFII